MKALAPIAHKDWDFFVGMASISPTKEVKLLKEFLAEEDIPLKAKDIQGKTIKERADFLYYWILSIPKLNKRLSLWAEACWQDLYEDQL